MLDKLTLNQLTPEGKKVLVRVDFNVPLNEKGEITDDTRIVASLPTIEHLLNQGASVILMSHLGRPKGNWVDKLTLAPCAKRLSQLLEKPVTMAPDCIGPEVDSIVHEMQPGDIVLLENLRFYPAEEDPSFDTYFAEQLARLGDSYVNDAFGTAHRAHSSTVEIAHFFPDSAAAGYLMEKELHFLGEIVKNPNRPFYAIIGGAKISSKIKVLKALINKVDALFIGGAMAFTFLKALGAHVGNSLYEEEFVDLAQEIIDLCKMKGVDCLLPEDVVITPSLETSAENRSVSIEEGIPDGWMGVDIGKNTRDRFSQMIRKGKTVFWNGPMGVFEKPPFDQGTFAIANTLAEMDTISLVGGGDSIAALRKLGIADKMTHISTGGGASLEFIELGTLPGIEALSPQLKSSKF